MLKPAILQRVIGMQFLHFESRPVVETSLMVYASGLVVSRRRVSSTQNRTLQAPSEYVQRMEG